MKTMMPKQTAIKRFLSYCAKMNRGAAMPLDYQFNMSNFEIDEPVNGKIRVFRDGSDKPKMIVFHSIQDADRNQCPAISNIALTEKEYEDLKNAFENKSR